MLFPKRDIGDFLEFIAFEFFRASLLQTIARDSIPDGSWFRLAPVDEYVDRLLEFFATRDSLLSRGSIDRWLKNWELPEKLAWLTSQNALQGFEREDNSEATLWSETEEGYAVLLVING